MIVALNFHPKRASFTVDLVGWSLLLRDIRTGEQFVSMLNLPVTLPAYGYALFAVDAEIARVG